jgi:hypothetical protein
LDLAAPSGEAQRLLYGAQQLQLLCDLAMSKEYACAGGCDAGAEEELEVWAQRIRWRGAVEEGGLVHRSTAQAENEEMERRC